MVPKNRSDIMSLVLRRLAKVSLKNGMSGGFLSCMACT